MSDRKAVIKNADMSEDMQQDAVECATQALEKYNIEKDIAAFIKKVNDASRDLHASTHGCCLRSGPNISTVCVCVRVCRGRGVGLGKAFSSSQQPSQCTHRSHTHTQSAVRNCFHCF